MTKIKNTQVYNYDVNISDDDFVIGSDADTQNKETKNYRFKNVRQYLLAGLSPEIGGTLKITEIVSNDTEIISPAYLVNALNPVVTVLQYNIVIVSLNGNKFLLKLQDITIGVLQDPVSDSDFITIVAFEKLGDGQVVYKGFNSATGRQEFYSLKSVGNNITLVSNNVFIEPKEGVHLGSGNRVYKGLNATTKLHEFYGVSNIGSTGVSVYKGLNPSTNSHEFYKQKSNTLSYIVDDETGEITWDLPSSAVIPALYVNDLYEPTYEDWVQGGGDLTTNPAFLYRGEGTLSKPFTNSRNYTSTVAFTDVPDSAIQNALDGHPTLSYVGPVLDGTRLSPNRVGEKIIVQDNTTSYNFTGNFGYSRLYIEVGGNINHTDTGMLFDMDNATHFNALSDSITIEILDGYELISVGNGLNNSGSNVATNNFAQSRSAILKGKGTLFFPNTDITKYVINSDITNSGNNNDGNTTFFIECKIRADYQGVLKIGGVSRVYNYGELNSGILGVPVNVNLKAYLLMGGQFRNFNTSILRFAGARTDGFVFTPTGGFTPSLVGQSTTIVSFNTITNLFNKTNNNNASLVFNTSDSSVSFSVTNIIESTNLWSVTIANNFFESGSIDPTKADLTNSNTTSASNKIGANIIESLRTFTSKENARLAGLPVNSAFLIQKYVSADNLLPNIEYKITTEGIPSLGTTGSYIVATGSETGTGVGLYSERCIMI